MKHTNTVMQQYCRAVRKKLPLPARQRRQLLAGAPLLTRPEHAVLRRRVQALFRQKDGTLN